MRASLNQAPILKEFITVWPTPLTGLVISHPVICKAQQSGLLRQRALKKNNPKTKTNQPKKPNQGRICSFSTFSHGPPSAL